MDRVPGDRDMRPFVLCVIMGVALLLPACGSGIDQSSPTAVVEGILEAARSGDYGGLAAVIDPAGGDNDAQAIRQAAAGDAAARERFRLRFAKGRVAGPAKGSGDRSRVPVLIGPDGTERDEFKMIKIDGKWYVTGL